MRVLEEVKDFEGMDAAALWHDVKFSFRHLKDFSRIAVVANPEIHNLWSSLVSPFMECEVEHFAPDQIEESAQLADVAGRRRRRMRERPANRSAFSPGAGGAVVWIDSR